MPQKPPPTLPAWLINATKKPKPQPRPHAS